MNTFEKKLKSWVKKAQKLPEFSFIRKLQKKYPKAEVFLVGGMVRDIALGKDSKDYDFVVRNISAKNLENFLKTQGEVNLVGKHFGVLKFKSKKFKGPEIDVALPRTEHSTTFLGGYRDFKIQSNPKLPIKKDLARRDFTINALALAVRTKNTELKAKNKKMETKTCFALNICKTSLELQNVYLIDPFNGLADLSKKIIRAVGKPELRFKEDYSRMLRAIRFSCQLEFNIEPKTWQAIKKLIKHINDKNKKNERIVPYEVIASEFLKSFFYNPVLALKFWDKSEALKILIPELLKMKKCPQPKNFHSEGDVWQHTILCLKNLKSKKFQKEFSNDQIDTELIMSILFHDLGKPYTIKKASNKIKQFHFYNHDVLGAELTSKILNRLHASSPPEFGVNIEKVSFLVKKHLFLIHGDIHQTKNTTLEKYFFKEPELGSNLLKLIYIDVISTIPPSGRPDMTLYKLLKNRLKKLKSLSQKRGKIVKPLVSGHDLMKTFKLKEGPKIGELLELLREAQLAGKIKSKIEGLKYIKKYL